MLSSEKETSEYSKTALFSLAIISKSFLKIADIFDDVSLNRLIEVKNLLLMFNQKLYNINFPSRCRFLRRFCCLGKKTFLKQRVRYSEVGVCARVTISTRSQSRSFPHISG